MCIGLAVNRNFTVDRNDRIFANGRDASIMYGIAQEILKPVARSQSGIERKSADWWDDLGISAAATQNISEVENIWRQLEGKGIISPAQSIDFTKAWIKRFEIGEEKQLYVTGAARGKVIALMPLVRKKLLGVNALTWFFGSHVGSNRPLVDQEALGELDEGERKKLWQRMGRAMIGADLLYLPAMPQMDEASLFDELGYNVPEEFLYRAEFSDWEECEKIQRTRSRKKHDKQQSTKLRAMGEVSFDELGPGPEALDAIDKMFVQKAIRFEQMGIKDPFAEEKTREFYKDLFRQNNALGAKLQVLSLNGEIVATRYNISYMEKIFVLITSMSEREEIRPGSPGKQSILHGMASIFQSGFTIHDMGAGFSDEKGRWCNKKYQLNTCYLALNKRGEMAAKLHRIKARARKLIKGNDRLFKIFKTVRLSLRKNLKNRTKAMSSQ
ncbi:MAG: GNAT family N-acetyltransferase [Devosiaceae bacterium]|nr:GNAT family N-acetyltransferase [Devosiaceae bacterium]